MTHRPQFKPWLRYEIIPSEGVFLLSERGHALLPGTIYIQLAPLLHGEHTVDEIIDRLKDHVSAAEVFYALAHLRNQGYVVDAPPSMSCEQAAFWDMLDVETETAIRRLQETTVSVFSDNAIDPAPFQALLTSLGVRVGDDGGCWVVLTNDYLQADLDVFNQKALTRDRPWMLVKPVGTVLWLGPLFLPGKTGCWACLAHRLRGARKVESYLQETKGTSALFPIPSAGLPSTRQTALSIAATEVAKWVVCGKNERLEGRVVTLNAHSLESDHHILVRRPQCPCCGDPKAFAARQSAPLVLQSHRKYFTTDGGHRIFTPEETLKKLEHHISPLTGIVSTLRSISPRVGEHDMLLTYITDHNFIHLDDDVYSLNQSLRGGSGGKGKHDTQAKASALGESIERYAGVFQGDEARIWAKSKKLGAAVIHPNACMLFSEQQFKDREQWNTYAARSTWVPEPFDTDLEIEWSPVWSLTYDELRYIPTAYCYYGYARKYGAWFARADSNGCAAGHSKEEAILQGFMELVERDSVALWWYNRLQKPAVDLGSFDEPYFQKLQAYYLALHRDLWVLDLTSDLNIATFVAISRRHDKDTEDIIYGFGTHFDSRIALLRALTEVNQSLPAVFSGTPDESEAYRDQLHEAIQWMQTATLANQPYLVPDETIALKVQADYPRCWSDDVATDVISCVQIASEKGLETLVLDQSRPDTGLHVVKVIVPGLRHFWPRFGPGRLYDVPVRVGWLPQPVTEDQLNPWRIYI